MSRGRGTGDPFRGHGRQRTRGSAAREPDTRAGTFQVHSRGQTVVDVGEAFPQVAVARRDRGGALDGDLVEVEIWGDPEEQLQGRVLQVQTRGRSRLTGILRAGIVEPDDPRLPHDIVVRALDVPALEGEAVLALIETYPASADEALGVRVVRRLGEPGLLLTEVARCLAAAEIDEEFPHEVEHQAAALPDDVRPEDLRAGGPDGRSDLRHLPFVTIDPQTARDFDDAVAVEHLPAGGWRVHVAVADVSHYVAQGSPLDREAARRGCSLYLPDRAIPMLPPHLSSGICSLVPHQDRLALVVRMDVAAEGQILDSAVEPAVIHSRGRLDYGGVAAALSGDFEGQRRAYREHATMLDELWRLAASLRRRRLERGALDLDLPEARVVLDDDDPTRVRDIVEARPDAPVKRAYSLIEELMVAANEVVGRMFERWEAPTIWRVHPAPRPENLETLRGWLAGYGLRLRRGAGGLADLLDRLASHRAARPLTYLVLRALKQASYSTKNVGHHGLASPAYLHFTSPIRRYPDLVVHRQVKRLLRGRRGAARLDTLEPLARAASARERRAIEVEREVHRIYAASLLRDRIGETTWGTISGVGAFGFFVTLDRPYVEGLVKSERSGERLWHDPERLRLFGRRAGRRVFSLGDRVEVRIVDTSVRRRHVDLALLPGPEHHEADPTADTLAWPEERPERGARGGRDRGAAGKRRDRGAARGRRARGEAGDRRRGRGSAPRGARRRR